MTTTLTKHGWAPKETSCIGTARSSRGERDPMATSSTGSMPEFTNDRAWARQSSSRNEPRAPATKDSKATLAGDSRRPRRSQRAEVVSERIELVRCSTEAGGRVLFEWCAGVVMGRPAGFTVGPGNRLAARAGLETTSKLADCIGHRRHIGFRSLVVCPLDVRVKSPGVASWVRIPARSNACPDQERKSMEPRHGMKPGIMGS
jgi:hypothetical protein